MEFNSFVWISELVSFSMQAYCFYIFKERKSLRLLMALACLHNILSVASHPYASAYFYQLYFGRIIIALVALWAVGDVCCYPATPRWTLRLPVAFAALLAIPYWPLDPRNGPADLEQYRLFCLCCGLFILALHTIFLIPTRQSITLPLLLLVTLTVEATGAAGLLKLGYHPQAQMFCWWIGLVALGSYQRTCSFGLKTGWLPSDPSVPPGAQKCENVQNTGATIRLPLQSRLPRARVFERLGI